MVASITNFEDSTNSFVSCMVVSVTGRLNEMVSEVAVPFWLASIIACDKLPLLDVLLLVTTKFVDNPNSGNNDSKTTRALFIIMETQYSCFY